MTASNFFAACRSLRYSRLKSAVPATFQRKKFHLRQIVRCCLSRKPTKKVRGQQDGDSILKQVLIWPFYADFDLRLPPFYLLACKFSCKD